MVKYPSGLGLTFYRPHNGLSKKGKNKFHANKTVIDGITFDSKAESYYYCYLKNLRQQFKYHQKFVIANGFKLADKVYRDRTYTPDFCIYKNHRLVKVVDIKGTKALTTDAVLRFFLFSKRYHLPITIARWDYHNKCFIEERK